MYGPKNYWSSRSSVRTREQDYLLQMVEEILDLNYIYDDSQRTRVLQQIVIGVENYIQIMDDCDETNYQMLIIAEGPNELLQEFIASELEKETSAFSPRRTTCLSVWSGSFDYMDANLIRGACDYVTLCGGLDSTTWMSVA